MAIAKADTFAPAVDYISRDEVGAGITAEDYWNVRKTGLATVLISGGAHRAAGLAVHVTVNNGPAFVVLPLAPGQAQLDFGDIPFDVNAEGYDGQTLLGGGT